MADREIDFNSFRALLHLQVRRAQLDPALLARLDASDVVQETLLCAHKARDQFRGQTEAEAVRWVQEILGNVMIDLYRRHTAEGRDPAVERSIQAGASDASGPLGIYLAAAEESPSQHVQRREAVCRLAEAVDRLPADERDAVVACHLLGLPVSAAAKQLERTEKSVAGLLYRAKKKLREWIDTP